MHIHIITFIMLLKHFESQETRVKITTEKVQNNNLNTVYLCKIIKKNH